MEADATLHPVLRRFRDAVVEMYGPDVDQVVLFGSRARGDGRASSDYGVAVFLRSMDDRMAEWDRLADHRVRFLIADGPFFDAIPFGSSDYDARTPLMHEIRRDGVILWCAAPDLRRPS